MANMYGPPVVVHLKKLGGKIIRDCDIYISNAIRNSSWDLEESNGAILSMSGGTSP